MSWDPIQSSDITRQSKSTTTDLATGEVLEGTYTRAGGQHLYELTLATSVAPIAQDATTIRNLSVTHQVLVGKEGVDDTGNNNGGGVVDEPAIIFIDVNPAVATTEQSGNGFLEFFNPTSEDWPTVPMPVDSDSRIDLTTGIRLSASYSGTATNQTYGTGISDFLYRPKLRIVFTVPSPTTTGGIFTGDDIFKIWWDATQNSILIGSADDHVAIAAPFNPETNTTPWCISIDDKGTHLEIKFGTYSGTIRNDPVTTAAALKVNYPYPVAVSMWIPSGDLDPNLPPLPMKLIRLYGWDVIANNKSIGFNTNVAQFLAVRYNSTIIQPAYGSFQDAIAGATLPKINVSSRLTGKIYDILKVDSMGSDGVDQYVVITYTDATIRVYTTQYFAYFSPVLTVPYQVLGCKIDVHSVYHGIVMNIFYHNEEQPNTAVNRLVIMTFYAGEGGQTKQYTDTIDLTKTMYDGYSETLSASTNCAMTVYKDPANPYRVIVYRMHSTFSLTNEENPVSESFISLRTIAVDFSSNDFSITDVSDRSDEIDATVFNDKHVECLGIVCKGNTAVMSIGVSDNAAYGTLAKLYTSAFNVYLAEGDSLESAMLTGETGVFHDSGFTYESNARYCDHQLLLGVELPQQFERRTMAVEIGGRPVMVDALAGLFYNYSTGRYSEGSLANAIGGPNSQRSNLIANSYENGKSASARLLSVNDDCVTVLRQGGATSSYVQTLFRVPQSDFTQVELPDSTILADGGFQVFVRFKDAAELNHNSYEFIPPGGIET